MKKNRIGMARYGSNVKNAFGVSVYKLHKLAKQLGRACTKRILKEANCRAVAGRGGDAKTRVARSVANDAIRELGSEKVKIRLKAKSK